MAVKANDWLTKLNSAKTQAAANKVITDMMNSTKGFLHGISDADQRAVTQVLNSYQKTYPSTNISSIIDTWSNTKNLKASQLNQLTSSFTAAVNTPNRSSDVRTATVVPTDGSPSYQVTADKQGNIVSSTKQTTTSKSTGGGGSVSYPSTSGGPSYQDIYDMIKANEPEKPREWTAREMADYHGLDWNKNLFKGEYDKATEDYYRSAMNEQGMLRNQVLGQSGLNLDKTIQMYLDAQRNAAPTTSQQAGSFANALATRGTAQYSNAQADIGMLAYLQQLEQNKQAELANNENLANQRYNKLSSILTQASGDKYKVDTGAYSSYLDYLGGAYSADRSTQAANARAAATQYAGAANAAISNAAAQAQRAQSQSGVFGDYYNYYTGTGRSDYDARTNISNLYGYYR